MDARIKAYIDHPGFESWDDINPIIIYRGVSLWAAIIEVDPTFPRSCGSIRGIPAEGKWRRFPSAELVLAAIKNLYMPKKKTLLEKIGLTRPKKYVYIEKSKGVWDNFFEREYRRPIQDVPKEIKLSTVSDKE